MREEGGLAVFNTGVPGVGVVGTPDQPKVPVGCLVQTGYGVFSSRAQDGIRVIQLSFGPGQAFDLWIDDVAFYR